MGTSISQRSPGTTSWNAVAAAYRNTSVPIERTVQELWRAAQSEERTDWGNLLASPIVFSLLEIALGSDSSASAMALANREIVRSRQSSLATDIAKRAIVLSFFAADRKQGFTEALFAEASNYLVSRDLPGYVGNLGRNRTVTDAIEFKESIINRVTEVVRSVSQPSVDNVESWGRLVALIAGQLTRR